MYALEQLRREAAALLKKASGLTVQLSGFSKPPQAEFGDLAWPAFELAKKGGKNPAQASQQAAAGIKPAGLVTSAASQGPYVNFFADTSKLAELVVNQSSKSNYGFSTDEKSKTVLVEYSQPNPNKPMHVGHLRNTLYGAAVANLLKASGNKVIQATLLNDRGIHICKSMLAYQKWGRGKAPDKKPDHFVGDYYALFAKKAAEEPALEKEALEMLGKWEAGDPAVRALWKKTTAWCYEGFDKTYSRLGASFDEEYFESDLYAAGKKIVEEGAKRGVFAKQPDNSVEADLTQYGLDKKTLLRADGTAIYVTADIELGRQKFEKHALDASLYCTGADQQFYFKQLFKIFELLGWKWASKCEHLWHGTVFDASGKKLSSREGVVVNADDLVDEVVALARTEAQKREKSTDINKTAEQIGLGALKFAFLSSGHQKDILFDKQKAVSFEGDTGPYVQYAHVRCASILEKLGSTSTPNYALLKAPEEKQLVLKIAEFPDIVKAAAQGRAPHEVAQYLLGLAQCFAAFYEDCPVAKADNEPLKAARSQLVLATKNTLKQGLALLGIAAPDKM